MEECSFSSSVANHSNADGGSLSLLRNVSAMRCYVSAYEDLFMGCTL